MRFGNESSPPMRACLSLVKRESWNVFMVSAGVNDTERSSRDALRKMESLWFLLVDHAKDTPVLIRAVRGGREHPRRIRFRHARLSIRRKGSSHPQAQTVVTVRRGMPAAGRTPSI